MHGAVVGHVATARLVLDLRAEDVYWCTADPGWVTGTSYGIVAPLVIGATSIVDAAEFDVPLVPDDRGAAGHRLVHRPTAIRRLMRAGDQAAEAYDLSSLRAVASVGEPLNPEAVVGQRVLHRTIRDNWWQTETGAIAIANYGDAPVRPGSMGRPVPGMTAAVLVRGEDGRAHRDKGHVTVEQRPNTVGELALRTPWPSMFRGYLHDDKRYADCFADGWYVTGDLARIDDDGYFWFVGRADDVIKTAGHLIGPFEVESVLMEHPAVAEAGVIGRPDPLVGEVVKAFVALKPGYTLMRCCAGTCSPTPGNVSGRPWPRRKSPSSRTCPRPGVARSCVACSRPVNWACPKATCLPWSSHEHRTPDRRARPRRAAAPDAARAPVRRIRCAELYSAAKIRGFLHLYIGEEAVAAGIIPSSAPKTPSCPPTESMGTPSSEAFRCAR